MSGPTFDEIYGDASSLFGSGGERGAKAVAQAEASRRECVRLFRALNGWAPLPRDIEVPDSDPRPTGSGWATDLGRPGWCL